MKRSFIVGDLGNSALKLGEFTCDTHKRAIQTPARTFTKSWNELRFEELNRWLGQSNIRWRLGSVNKKALESLTKWIQERGDTVQLVSHVAFPMPLVVRHPERVGIDRLAAAWAANAMRPPHHAAIVVDAGTAITIDCVTASGQFIGGSIAPGMQLGLKSLHSNTDQLPLEKIDSVPSLVGDNTTAAIRSGVYWMTTHGIDGMIAKLKTEMASPCFVFGTGGAMPMHLQHLEEPVQHYPHLVLSGVAMANQ